MLSVSDALSVDAALVEFRRLLSRRDLDDHECAAVLRDNVTRRTLLFSRFDLSEQRLLQDDQIDLERVFSSNQTADEMTQNIVASRLRKTEQRIGRDHEIRN
jgi:hypothetical protein